MQDRKPSRVEGFGFRILRIRVSGQGFRVLNRKPSVKEVPGESTNTDGPAKRFPSQPL